MILIYAEYPEEIGVVDSYNYWLNQLKSDKGLDHFLVLQLILQSFCLNNDDIVVRNR